MDEPKERYDWPDINSPEYRDAEVMEFQLMCLQIRQVYVVDRIRFTQRLAQWKREPVLAGPPAKGE